MQMSMQMIAMRIRMAFLLMFPLVMFFVSGCNRVPEPKAPQLRSSVAAVPMQLIHVSDQGGLPLIPVTLEGRQTWWLIDTGSSHNLVSLRLLGLLKLKQAATSQLATIGGRQSTGYYRLPDLQIGGLALQRQSAAAVDLSVLSGSDGLMVDGILGMPAFGRLVMSLDYPGRRVSFASSAEGLNPHSVIPFRIEANVPVVSLAVLGGRQGDFMLDTGNSGALVVLPAYAGPQHGLQAGSTFIDVEDIGGSVPTQLALLSQLQLGNLRLQQVPLSLPVRNKGVDSVAGSAGNALFAGQQVTFDFPNQQLLLNGRFGGIPLAGSFGFLLAAGNTLEVVLANSPAATNGLQVGDSIVAVNGRGTRSASSHVIWAMLHQQASAQLTLVRGGQPYSVTLPRGYFLPPLQ